MTIEHIGQEFTHGITAMVHLVHMLEEAIERAGISGARKSPSWWRMGFTFTLDSNDYFAGIYFAYPEQIFMQYENPTADQAEFEKLEEDRPGYESSWEDDKPYFSMYLNHKETCFFAKTKELQLDSLTTFLRKSLSKARMCKSKKNGQKSG